MVSLGRLEENLGNFINLFSKKKGKKLNRDELESFARQATILKSLLEGAGFDSQPEELNKVRKSVLSRGSIEESDIRKLREILSSL